MPLCVPLERPPSAGRPRLIVLRGGLAARPRTPDRPESDDPEQLARELLAECSGILADLGEILGLLPQGRARSARGGR